MLEEQQLSCVKIQVGSMREESCVKRVEDCRTIIDCRWKGKVAMRDKVCCSRSCDAEAAALCNGVMEISSATRCDDVHSVFTSCYLSERQKML